MSKINRIDLPVSIDLHMTAVKGAGKPDDDGNPTDLWVAAGPNNAIADACEAGGIHVMTRRGPRVVLVDRIVKLSTGLAIVPIEVDFDTVKTTTRAVEDMSADELRALLAAKEGNGAKVTSSGRGRANGARKSTAAAKAASKPANVSKSAAASKAVEDVDDSELSDLLVS